MNFRLVVRITAILLGIASTVLLAQRAFALSFNRDFLLLLDLLHNAIGIVVLPFELLFVKPAQKWLQDHGWSLELHGHWKNVFVLMWLFTTAHVRAYSNPLSEKKIVEALGLGFRNTFLWIWGGLCALVASMLAGSVLLSSSLIFVYPIAGIGMCEVGTAAFWAVMYGNDKWPGWSVFTGWMQRFAKVFVPAVFGSGAMLAVDLHLNVSPSPGLVALAAAVGLLGLGFLIEGVAIAIQEMRDYGGRFWTQLAGLRVGNLSLDMLSVLGGAAIIVYLAHLMA